jgi:hypothetical protein
MRKQFVGTRRAVIVKALLGAAGLGSAGPMLRARAQSGEKMNPSDPLAQSVKYVEDATRAPADLRKPDSFCNNCQFYQGDQASDSAPCTTFMGKLVPAQAWCSTWVMKGAETTPGRRSR